MARFRAAAKAHAQPTSAIDIARETLEILQVCACVCVCICINTLIHTCIHAQPTSGIDIARETRTSAYVSIRQHTSAYVSMRQHTSAYVSIRRASASRERRVRSFKFS